MEDWKNARCKNSGTAAPSTATLSFFSKRLAFLSSKMAPIYPLLGIMTVAFGLAGMTIGRGLAVSPDVLVNKHKRKNVPDLTDPEAVFHQATRYVDSSPFRRLAKEHKGGVFFAPLTVQTGTASRREFNHYGCASGITDGGI